MAKRTNGHQGSTHAAHFGQWEKVKDLVDQNIDIMLNYRQSGHPGGSRSKVHAFTALTLGGFLRFDIRHPEKPFGDRFILSAGHTVPLVYAALAVYNEALRIKFEQTGDPRYSVPNPEERAVLPADLAGLRHRGGLSGHAEMQGKTLFLKWNTGPSGHGLPASVGEAFALKRAGAGNVNVVALEGEGGLTPGGSHESKNSAWGLGLGNLYYLVDWNDFGIDARPASSVIHGTPSDWFSPYGWRVFSADDGSDWESITAGLSAMFGSEEAEDVPSVLWFRTRKGRGYLKYDNKSHGAAHAMNSELFWNTKQEFADKYGVTFAGFGEPAPQSPEAVREQCLANLEVVSSVLRSDKELCSYIADTLIGVGESVPERVGEFRLDTKKNPAADPALCDYRAYPDTLFVPPGKKIANRAALAAFGSWVNAYSRQNYGRPLFMACSADLADSTNISGFGADWEETAGYGWYNRESNPEGVLLPQEITEFTNAGIAASLATVNFSPRPFEEFDGFYGACSTYGAFSYLKYGEMRLFSQLAQDCEIKVGKVLWVVGHSGPETAEDARTHFGIFSPTVTQLFPDGQVVNLYPWEYNEVPVLLGAALGTGAHIIALHLTRPAITVPDRSALGMDSHFDAARGAYLIRDYTAGKPRMGTVIVQGTMSTANVVAILPEIERAGLNVKIVAAVSLELFRTQETAWQDRVLPKRDRVDSTVISNGSRRSMGDWIFNDVSAAYALTSDADNRWRTGGSVEEVVEEAGLAPKQLLTGIKRFAEDRRKRLTALQELAAL